MPGRASSSAVGDPAVEIGDLVHGYADLVDRGEFARVGELFAEATYRAVTGDGIATFSGAEEVTRCMESMVITYEGIPRTKHVTTNLMVDLDEDRGAATARSYYSVLQALPDLPLQVIVAGRYEDAFATNGRGGWRFADRLVYMDLVGDLSRHLRVLR